MGLLLFSIRISTFFCFFYLALCYFYQNIDCYLLIELKYRFSFAILYYNIDCFVLFLSNYRRSFIFSIKIPSLLCFFLSKNRLYFVYRSEYLYLYLCAFSIRLLSSFCFFSRCFSEFSIKLFLSSCHFFYQNVNWHVLCIFSINISMMIFCVFYQNIDDVLCFLSKSQLYFIYSLINNDFLLFFSTRILTLLNIYFCVYLFIIIDFL